MHFERVKYEAFKNDMMTWRPMNFLGGEIDEAYDGLSLIHI